MIEAVTKSKMSWTIRLVFVQSQRLYDFHVVAAATHLRLEHHCASSQRIFSEASTATVHRHNGYSLRLEHHCASSQRIFSEASVSLVHCPNGKKISDKTDSVLTQKVKRKNASFNKKKNAQPKVALVCLCIHILSN